jgi:hypothetical protein
MASMVVGFFALRFIDFGLFIIMWEVLGFLYLTLPLPVTLKRFFALECVFIFGISISLITKGYAAQACR